MLKTLVRGTAYRLAPRWAAEMDLRLWMRKKLAELKRRAEFCQEPGHYVDALQGAGAFVTMQIRSEIVGLMSLLSELRPQHVCEIGAGEGGTLFLLSQVCPPTARIVSVDLYYTVPKLRTFPGFAKAGQEIRCLKMDSQSPATVEAVSENFGGEKLDFLFIDGDHTYEGVSADFEAFAPLVRPGGIIAFHDIVPDFRTRHGIKTHQDVGEVPIFWREIRERYDGCREFIDDAEQDGRGIGVLTWPG